MDFTELIMLFSALGMAVGFAGGMFGIGGGIILVPTFMYIFPLTGVRETVLMHMALGTSVAMLGPTSLASSIEQYRIGNLRMDFYRTWAMGIATGVIMGLLIVSKISTRELKLLFAVFLIFATCFMFTSKENDNNSNREPAGPAKFLASVAIGMLSLLTGTGGSTFTVPSLKVMGMDIKRAIAIASATAPIISIIGIAGFICHGIGVPDRPTYAIGYVDTLVFLCMTPTAMIGAPIGVKVGNNMNKNLLQHIFAVLIMVIALHTLYNLYPTLLR